MKIRKDVFLNALEAVSPGVTNKEDVEQSDCFAFKNGTVFTYSGEMALRCKSGLPKEVEGAIKAKELLAHFRKMVVDEVDIEDKGNVFLVSGKGERIKFVKEREVSLPIDNVEEPEEWTKLPEDFVEAVKTVQECAGKNKEEFVTVCVHIAGDWLEAFDNYQICRYYTKTGLKQSSLVRRDSIRHIVDMNVIEFSESSNWVHFRNPSGLVISCSRSTEEYPDVTDFLKSDGASVKLPKGLGDKVSSAEVSSASNKDYNQVKIILNGDKQKMYVIGLGVTSEYTGWKNIPEYTGKAISFMISPKLLANITKKYTECQISEDKLKVKGDKFDYCSCLSRVVEKELKEAEIVVGETASENGDIVRGSLKKKKKKRETVSVAAEEGE